jgi:hypothetical protein
MLVVCTYPRPEKGAPPLSLQLVERPAESTLECGGDDDGLETMQKPTKVGQCSIFRVRVIPDSDGCFGGY